MSQEEQEQEEPQIFFGLKIFKTQIFSDKFFFNPKFFQTKVFFQMQNFFQTQNSFLNPKNFRTNNFFWTKQTQDFFGSQNF